MTFQEFKNILRNDSEERRFLVLLAFCLIFGAVMGILMVECFFHYLDFIFWLPTEL